VASSDDSGHSGDSGSSDSSSGLESYTDSVI
jgi:hypothetical protein